MALLANLHHLMQYMLYRHMFYVLYACFILSDYTLKKYASYYLDKFPNLSLSSQAFALHIFLSIFKNERVHCNVFNSSKLHDVICVSLAAISCCFLLFACCSVAFFIACDLASVFCFCFVFSAFVFLFLV